MLGIFKKLFTKSEENQNQPSKDSDSSLTRLTEELEIDAELIGFKKQYQEKAKKIRNAEEFHRFAVAMVVERIRETDFGKHPVFLNEIKYFIYFLLLVLKDDYDHGDRICQKTLTQFDNYIFSTYRKRPELAENIKKITALANSKRFTENPKENVLSYFVFLEENGVDLMEILQDYTNVLDNNFDDNPEEDADNAKNPKAVAKKHSEKKNKIDIDSEIPFQNLHSVPPSIQNSSINPKNLDDKNKK